MNRVIQRLRFVSIVGIVLWLLFSITFAWADGETGTFTSLGPGHYPVAGTLDGNHRYYGAYTFNFQLSSGGIVPVFCTDLRHYVYYGDTFVASDEVMACPVRWLLLHYPPRLSGYTPWPDQAGALSNINYEMAARQAAVWHFSDGFIPYTGNTIGDRAWAIINEVPDDPCAADQPVIAFTPASAVNPINTTQLFTVTVTRGGTPVSGQVVALTVDSGTLSTDTVTTNDQGQVTFTIIHGVPDTTSHINATAEMLLPVGTIFVGTEPNKQKLVLGEEVIGTVQANAVATWTGTGSVTTISFDDYDMDREHDAGEPLLEGWTVKLYKNGSLIKTETTDSDGQARFTGLSAGNYRVEEVLKGGWYATTSLTEEFTLANDESHSFTFGQIKLPVIIGHVFQDDDLDDTPDAGDPPLEGWELQLYRQNGSLVVGMQGQTGADGKVVFSSTPDRNPPEIGAGTYFVQETLKPGWYTTTGISRTVTVGSGDIGHAWLGNVYVATFAVNDDEYQVDEDHTLSVAAPGVLDNDFTPLPADLTASLVTGVSHGTLDLHSDGSFVYMPTENWAGIDHFVYAATDGINSDTATVTITVNAKPDLDLNGPAPGVNFTATFIEDGGAVPIVDAGLSVTDVDDTHLFSATVTLTNHPDGAAETLMVTTTGTSIAAVYDASTGVLSLTGSDTITNYESVLRTVRYNNTSQNPDDTDRIVHFVTNDGDVDSDVVTSTVTVIPVNDLPVAGDDGYTTAEDIALTVTAPGVLGNDSDVEDDLLKAVRDSGPNNGTLTLNPDGSFVYTPTANFNGSDSFTYHANDGQGDSNVATVVITVTPVNDAPVAENDHYTTTEDIVLTVAAPGVLDNDSDVEGDSLEAVRDDGPNNGTLTLNSDGSFVYTPTANFNGSDSFTYHANDGQDDSNVATVIITVTPVNDGPTANDDSASTGEDTPVTINVRGNDVDAEDTPAGLAVSSVTQPANGEVKNNGTDVIYTPTLNFNGTDSFTYVIRDTGGLTDTATVTVNVGAENDSPNALDDTATTDEDTAVEIDVLDNDTDAENDTLFVSAVGSPDHGTVEIKNNKVTYTPEGDFYGTDTFTYTANDTGGLTDVATVTVTVIAINDAPSFTRGADQVVNEDAGAQTADAWATDISDGPNESGQLLTFIVTNDNNGLFSAQPAVNASGDLTYTPAGDMNGSATVTVVLKDDGGDDDTSASQTFTITVRPVNDAPSFTRGSDQTAGANAGPQIVNDWATDISAGPPDEAGQVLTFTLTNDDNALFSAQPAINSNGDLTFTLNPARFGSAAITVTLKDSGGTANGGVDTVTRTFIITITRNTAPIAEDDVAVTIVGVPVAIYVLDNDSDLDGDLLSVVAAGISDYGDVEISRIKVDHILYTPKTPYNVVFTYTVSDGSMETTANVSVFVGAPDVSPIGGYTEPVRARELLWLQAAILIAAVGMVTLVVAALGKERGRKRTTGREFP